MCEDKILVETSARHVHLTQEDVEKLFGEGYQLTVKKMLGILVVLSGAAVILQRGRINHEGRPKRQSETQG